MKSLSLLKIQTRIAMLALIPLVAITIFSIERLGNALTTQSDIRELDVILDYVDVAYPMINASISESFYSRVYIDGDPSYSSKYLKLLSTARATTDKSARQYETYLAEKRESLHRSPVLAEHLKEIDRLYKVYLMARIATDKKLHLHKTELNGDAFDVHTIFYMGLYTARLVSSLSEVVVLSSKDPHLGLKANALNSLVVAGAESANLNSMMFAGANNPKGMEPYVYAEIYYRLFQEEKYKEQFVTFSSESMRTRFDQLLAKDPSYLKVQQIVDRARSPEVMVINEKIAMDDVDWVSLTDKTHSAYTSITNEVLREFIGLKNELVSTAQTSVIFTIVMMVVLILAISGVSFLIGRSIYRPLKDLVSTCIRLAREKDMTISLNDQGRDELAELSRAFNALIRSFNSALNGVKVQADSMGSTTEKVATAMSESLILSDNQLAATDSISTAVTQMSVTIEHVNSMTQNTSSAVQNAREIAVKNAENASENRELMETLTVELGNTGDVVHKLNDEANQIGNVLNVIQGIAEQTNLLALNAAIEAARAGELGRGFAVVADEVRSLAKKTQDSTEQIRHQIESLQKGSEAATANMEKLRKEGSRSVKKVMESASAVEMMKVELDNITQMSLQISNAAQEQTAVANEISERIVAVRDDSETAANRANLTVDSTKELTSNSQKLNEYINAFHLRD